MSMLAYMGDEMDLILSDICGPSPYELVYCICGWELKIATHLSFELAILEITCEKS